MNSEFSLWLPYPVCHICHSPDADHAPPLGERMEWVTIKCWTCERV